VLRVKAIKDPSLCRTFKATFSERSDVVNRVGNEKVDFTGHELKTFVKEVNLVRDTIVVNSAALNKKGYFSWSASRANNDALLIWT
jgi:hypothetical protein